MRKMQIRKLVGKRHPYLTKYYRHRFAERGERDLLEESLNVATGGQRLCPESRSITNLQWYVTTRLWLFSSTGTCAAVGESRRSLVGAPLAWAVHEQSSGTWVLVGGCDPSSLSWFCCLLKEDLSLSRSFSKPPGKSIFPWNGSKWFIRLFWCLLSFKVWSICFLWLFIDFFFFFSKAPTSCGLPEGRWCIRFRAFWCQHQRLRCQAAVLTRHGRHRRTSRGSTSCLMKTVLELLQVSGLVAGVTDRKSGVVQVKCLTRYGLPLLALNPCSSVGGGCNLAGLPRWSSTATCTVRGLPQPPEE